MSTALLLIGSGAVVLVSLFFSLKSIVDTRRKYYDDYLKQTGRDNFR